MANKLTEKQENFCKNYILNGGNATQAYKAVYGCKNYKQESIEQVACRTLKNVKVMSRIEELKKPKEKEFVFKREQAFNKYERIYDEGLEKVMEYRGEDTTIEKGACNLSAAKGAIDSQCKLFGLLIDKSEHDHTSKGEQIYSWLPCVENKEEE